MAKDLYLVCGPNEMNWIVKAKSSERAIIIVSDKYMYEVSDLYSELVHRNCVPVILNKATVSFSYQGK